MSIILEVELYTDDGCGDGKIIILTERSSSQFVVFEYSNRKSRINNNGQVSYFFSSIEEALNKLLPVEEILNIRKITFVGTEIYKALLSNKIANKNILLYLAENTENEYLLPFYDVDYLDTEYQDNQALFVKKKTAFINNYFYISNIQKIDLQTLEKRNGFAFLDEEYVEDKHKKVKSIFYSFDTLMSGKFFKDEIEYYDDVIKDMESIPEQKEDLEATRSLKKYFIEDFLRDMKNSSNNFPIYSARESTGVISDDTSDSMLRKSASARLREKASSRLHQKR